MVQISSNSRVALLVLFLTVGGFSAPVIATASSTDGHSNHGLLTLGVEGNPQEKTPSNNSTQVRHKDPSKVQSQEELGNLEQWLAGQLGSRLKSSTVKLSQGEYQAADSVVGDRYNKLLGKYVDVAGRTKGTKDDQRIKKFKSAKKNQAKYSSKVAKYRRTYKKYQRAKKNGNDQKARSLARRLNNLSTSINRTSGNLTNNYQDISNSTDADLTQQRETVQKITSNVTHQTAEVRSAEFVQTEISAEIESSEVSFREPITITGELVDENGTELSNETIRLQLGGNRTNVTTTDEDGDFTITGRPAVLPLGEQSVTLDHVPNASSIYLGSNTTVEADIQQTQPTITLSQSPKHGRYNKTITVSGRVHVDDVGDKGIPVIVKSGKTVIGNTTTQEDGSFTLSENLSSAVPAGNRQLQVSVPLQNRALAFTSTRAPITIHPTNTSLNITSRTLNQGNLSVSGNLTTANGVPLSNQTVILRANGSQVGTVTTDSNGTYTSQVQLPPSLAATNKTHVRLSAVYSGKGTNLDATQASSLVRLQPATSSNSFLLWAGVAGVGVLLTIGGFAIQRSGWFSDSEESAEPKIEENQLAPDTDIEEAEETKAVTIREWADQAATALAENELQTAVETAYATGRQYYLATDETISETGRTHWEFYQFCQDQDFTDQEIERLRQLTMLYEQATFTTTSITQENAEQAVELANQYADKMEEAH
ncbi:MSCRAMM family protein [Haladaptatus salinisoli]|uniref:MSCRAMM family protein n=1 Tax=Haladaptatus salinisoli TaxID=2884876 RepID=UPI001D0B33E8|nr:hypothetical protein [Haladaptatus salinisoli]